MDTKARILDTLAIARIAVFTALATVITMIPAFSIAGVEGASITLGAIVPVVLGVMLTPHEAIVSAILVGILSTVIPPPGAFGPLSPLPLIIGTIAVVLVYRFDFKGLVGYLALHLGLVALFIAVSGKAYFNEYPLYTWLHFLGVLAVLILSLKRSQSTLLLTTSITGVLVDHITGSVIAQIYFPSIAGYPIPGEIWAAITWIYPIERTILIAIAYTVLMVLYKVGVPAPWAKK